MALSTLLAFSALVASTFAHYPNCQTLKIPLNVTAQTLKITAPPPNNTADAIAVTELFISLNGAANATAQSVDGTQEISDTYYIISRLCMPVEEDVVAAHADTVQLLIHGIGGSSAYWDQSFDDYRYSYVDAAAKRGFATLAIDRLGIGETSKPDPAQAVQTATQIEIARLLASGLKAGSLGFSGGKRFNKVVGVGHSYGSIQLNGLAASAPDAVDAVVLTGYSHNTTGVTAFLAGNQVDLAKNVDPTRFNLANGYLLASSSYGATFVFFHAGGYDPEIGKLAYRTRGTVTVGENFSLTQGINPAPNFTGPVLTVTGDRDNVFCAGACYGVNYPPIVESEAQYWPASSNFSTIVPPETGHFINYHRSAPATYQQIFGFLAANSF